MIARDVSLFVFMGAFNQASRRPKQQNSFRIRVMLQVEELQQVLVTVSLEYFLGKACMHIFTALLSR